MKKAFKSALLDIKQATVDAWIQSIKGLVILKEKEILLKKEAEQKKTYLITHLREAREKGATLRELSEITNLSHSTIARWLDPEKYKYKPKKHKMEIRNPYLEIKEVETHA